LTKVTNSHRSFPYDSHSFKMNCNNFVSHDNISGSKNLPQEEKPFLSTSSNKYEENDAYFNDGETTPPASQSVWTSFGSWWLIEILSSIISLAAMGSMVVVLQHFDELEARTWQFGITINSVIAALSTVARTAFMIPVGSAVSQASWIWFSAANQEKGYKTQLVDLETFDDASRGAWGSLKLLWRMKGRCAALISKSRVKKKTLIK
jgi:hypothetical protein